MWLRCDLVVCQISFKSDLFSQPSFRKALDENHGLKFKYMAETALPSVNSMDKNYYKSKKIVGMIK